MNPKILFENLIIHLGSYPLNFLFFIGRCTHGNFFMQEKWRWLRTPMSFWNWRHFNYCSRKCHSLTIFWTVFKYACVDGENQRKLTSLNQVKQTYTQTNHNPLMCSCIQRELPSPAFPLSCTWALLCVYSHFLKFRLFIKKNPYVLPHKRLLNSENKLRVAGAEVGGGLG